jgi:hypothetical protein
MKARPLNYGAIPAALAALLLLSSFSLAAQDDAQPASRAANAKPTPRTQAGHPDLTGFWFSGMGGLPDYGKAPVGNLGNLTRTADGSEFFDYGGSNGAGPAPDDQPLAVDRNPVPYKPEYIAKVKAIAATAYGGTTALDPQHDCKPHGVPRLGIQQVQIVENDQYIALLYEAAPGPIYRIIYTDGREHPKDLDTSYLGHSIGHWEGDTLVTDVVGLNDETWLGGATASIHSDKEHVTERWTRQGDELTYEATVEDPVMFSKPWVITPRHTKIAAEGDYVQPQMCLNNDKPHFIQPSATDQFKCNWCQKDADTVYGEGAEADNKARANANKRGAGGGDGGGGE